MRLLLVFLLLFSVANAAKDTPLQPIRIRELSLQKVPLKEGERIASIEVEVGGASFSQVRIPIDWSMEIGAPVSGIAVLKGGTSHCVGMPFTTDGFRRFLALAFYDYGADLREFSIKVKLGLYLYDEKKGESERVLELSSDSIVLEEPIQPPQTTTGSSAPSRV